jgi:hypothetical protein
VTWKTDQEALGGTNVIFPLPNQFPHCGIGDEVAAAHIFHRLCHGACLVGFYCTPGGTEKIARRNVTNFQALAQEFALCAFPHSRPAQ